MYSPSPHLLIVEDDRQLNNELRTQLEFAHFSADQCFDGEEGLKCSLSGRYSIILLDVLLPKMDGFTLLEKLRLTSNTPVIMLTAKGAEQDRILGFTSGADDYLPKPFNMQELILRIGAIIRRTANSAISDEPMFEKNQLVFEDLNLKIDQRLLACNQSQLKLTDIESRLLGLFLKSPGELLSKSHLHTELLHRPLSRYDRSIDMHVSNLRRKLKKVGFSSNRLVTMHGQGYCLQ